MLLPSGPDTVHRLAESGAVEAQPCGPPVFEAGSRTRRDSLSINSAEARGIEPHALRTSDAFKAASGDQPDMTSMAESSGVEPHPLRPRTFQVRVGDLPTLLSKNFEALPEASQQQAALHHTLMRGDGFQPFLPG